MSDNLLRILVVGLVAPAAYFIVFEGSNWLVKKLMKESMLKRILLHKFFG